MYAILLSGGKQVKAEVGQTIYIEKIDGNVGDAVSFSNVLYVESEKVYLGQPYVENATVKGKIVKVGRQPKIHVLRYKSKSNLRVRHGHRQPYTAVAIESIEVK